MSRILLVDTTAYSPVSPIFSDALDEWCKEHNWTWTLADESKHFKLTWNHNLVRQAMNLKPAVVLVVKGASIHTESLKSIKHFTNAILVCYATDDPWNVNVCSEDVRECIPVYDHYITCKTAILDDLKKAGAKKVRYLPVGYKPSIHFPEAPANDEEDEEAERYACDLAVIGGADDERIATVKRIREAMPKIELLLYGGYWNRDPELEPYAQGIVYGRAYRLAIGGAKVCLNLIRTANRDQHNMRSFEIPACGGVQLTPWTQEHNDLRIDAQFFSSDSDMLKQLKFLLEHGEVREWFRFYAGRDVQPHTYQARVNQLMEWVMPWL